MPHVPVSAATVISDEVKDLIHAQDDTLLANQRLFVSVLTAARDSGALFSEKQKAFAALHENTTKLLDARWAIGDTLKLLRGMAPAFGAEVVMEGCVRTCPAGTGGISDASLPAASDLSLEPLAG